VSSSPSLCQRSSHLPGRLQLLSLLRRKIHCQRSFLHQESIQQARPKHPTICTRTKRGITMAPINSDLVCCFHSWRKVLRGFRLRRSR
jgi:hypothetical protein